MPAQTGKYTPCTTANCVALYDNLVTNAVYDSYCVATM